MSKKVSLIIAGCGGRGSGYARYVEEHPKEASVVAVADPREFYRTRLGEIHRIPEERRFHSWEEMARLPKFADAVMICTQDAMHEAPCVAFAGKGYHILLEKPMAPTEESCRRIVETAEKNHIILAVCHVLRYTLFTKALKALILSGKIGEIVSIQRLEGVGFWHQAHSFVRGNWRNEKESSPMLLAKACHDMDWLRYIMDKPCTKVHSFGSLRFFRRENQPEGAADRCTECPEEIESICLYSARRIYLTSRLGKSPDEWPFNVLASDTSPAGILKALKEGPYGRCVFACDNDVVDNQVVNLEFKDGSTASFTMTAMTGEVCRKTRIFGTLGSVECVNNSIEWTDFLTGKTEPVALTLPDDGSIMTGHGGGDAGLMESFLEAVAKNDPSKIASGPEISLESHRIVFAAERSRHMGTVENIS